MKQVCKEACEHLRSFRFGFDGEKIVFAYNPKEKLATCALKTDETMRMRAYPLCWREANRG